MLGVLANVVAKINAGALTSALWYADCFVLSKVNEIPLPVRVRWQELRSELVTWRDRLETDERRKK